MFTDDKDIERELNAALKVVPSSDFEAGVLLRVQQDPPSRQRWVAPVWLAAAAAVLLAAGVWILGNAGSRPVAPDPVAAAPSVADAAPQPPVEPPILRPAVPPPSGAPRSVRSESGPKAAPASSAEPEVIVPAGQLVLIRRLVGDANAGRPTLPKPAGDPAAEPAELVIPPLVVLPMAVTGAEPGGGLS